MRIDDDTVGASHATRALLHLYDAYRAAVRAQIAAFQQAQRHVTANEKAPEQREIKLAVLRRREALASLTDAVYAERREQVRRRLYELLALPELP